MRVRALSILVAVGCLALLASGCNWPQLGFGPGHTDDNVASAITTSNVSTLTEKFTDSFVANVFSQPAIVNGVMYVVSNGGQLYAYSAKGTTNCSGTPTSCTPLWSADVGGVEQTPAVVDGKVFVFNDEANQVEGFDAAGKANCSGTPTVCTPVWEATVTNGEGQSVVASRGVLYVTSLAGATVIDGDVVEAFDASGTTNCSGTPTTCAPLWTSTAFGAGEDLQFNDTVSVSNGVAYVLDGVGILAFDAKGVTDCSGTPTVCSPLWQYTGLTGNPSEFAVISGSTLFVDTFTNTGSPINPNYVGALYAFDANGVTDCSGTPKMCTPQWQSAAGSESAVPPTVANGFVYVPTFDGPIDAFDANGSTNCSGAPKICTPVWATSVSTTVTDGWGGPVVVGGDVLYAAPDTLATGATGHAYAFDANGVTDCVSSVCSPLWSTSSSTFPSGNLTIANGMLYLSGTTETTDIDGGITYGGIVEAYGLPS